MDFHRFVTLYGFLKSQGMADQIASNPRDFYGQLLQEAVVTQNKVAINQFTLESRWLHTQGPYYLLWPGIIPSLIRLKLSCDSGSISMIHSHDVICLRFPKQQNPISFEFDGQKYEARSVMLAAAELYQSLGISMWMDFGETCPKNTPIYTFRNLPCIKGVSIEEALDKLPVDSSWNMGVRIPDEIILQVVKICATICLLEEDPAIIEPDVLAKDRAKFDATGDHKFVEKAHRKGKVGWHIGRNVEVSPHVRSASPAALYWTGPGRTIPKIRFRRGCIVHRRKVVKMPTDYQGDDN